MRDYKFGDFLCERRKTLSLSQFQLGRLVGVSDKAVSKWENGTAKPKSSLLPKLAEVLDISIDELLNCKLNQKASSGEAMLSKIEIWEIANARIKEIYGENVPLRAINRLNKEKEKLSGTLMPFLYAIVGQISAVSNAKKYEVTNSNAMGSSFLAYLLGANSINPLKPHYLCPKCKKVHFMTGYQCAWDLPERICTCGCEMERLGHDIPFETVYSEIKSKCALCNVAKSMINEVIEIVKELSKDVSVVCVLPEEDSKSWYNPYRFFFVADGEKGFKTVRYSEESAYDLYTNYSLCVQPNEVLDNLSVLCQECGVALNKIHPTQKLLDGFLSVNLEGIFTYENDSIKAMISTIKPKTYHELLKALAMGLGERAWDENGSVLFKSGIPFDQLIAFRDDVFTHVMNGMVKQGIYDGQDFAYKIMNDTRQGIYNIRGMADHTKHSLEELALPDWFVSTITKIQYLSSKAHVVHYLKAAIYLMWFKLNYPESFAKRCL